MKVYAFLFSKELHIWTFTIDDVFKTIVLRNGYLKKILFLKKMILNKKHLPQNRNFRSPICKIAHTEIMAQQSWDSPWQI